MRLLTMPFISSAEFLSHYSTKHPDGALFCRTRTELEVDEPVLVEISFPGLPNRALVRAHVHSLEAGKGAWLVIEKVNSSTRDFVVGLARGEIEVTHPTERSYSRFPATLPVAIRVADESDTKQHPALAETRTGDVSAGGVFIHSETPPPVGTRVQLVIEPPGEADRFSLEGEVSWIGDGGFGVHFSDKRREDNRRLRTLLRRASESGRVRFAAT